MCWIRNNMYQGSSRLLVGSGRPPLLTPLTPSAMCVQPAVTTYATLASNGDQTVGSVPPSGSCDPKAVPLLRW